MTTLANKARLILALRSAGITNTEVPSRTDDVRDAAHVSMVSASWYGRSPRRSAM